MVADVLCIHCQPPATSIELSTAREYCQDSYNVSEQTESDNTNVRYDLNFPCYRSMETTIQDLFPKINQEDGIVAKQQEYYFF